MIDVNCLCLKGFGNNLINTLSRHANVNIKKIYTRKEKASSYYYPAANLEELACIHNIPLEYVEEKGEWGIEKSDLIIISTYHRILREIHLKSAPLIINIHPSILPGYKGATPTNWQICDDVQFTGVTAHFIDSEKIDSGPILFQEKIFNPKLTDWQMRQSLAKLSEKIIDKIIINYPNYTHISEEDINPATSSALFHRTDARTITDATIEISKIHSLDQLGCLIRAFDNYPRLRIKVNDNKFMVCYEDFTDLLHVEIDGLKISLPGLWIN